MTLRLILVVCLVCGAFGADDELDGDSKLVRQDYSSKVNMRLQEQIRAELQASFFYQAYSYYFSRSDVALPGFSKFFAKMSDEERGHAEQLMAYINKRGGAQQLNSIQLKHVCDELNKAYQANETKSVVATIPGKGPCICYFMVGQRSETIEHNFNCGERHEWGNFKDGLSAMQDALLLERFVNDRLLQLHKFVESDRYSDPHASHLLEHAFLDEQVNSIKEMADFVTQLKKFDDKLGEYIFDKNLLEM